MITKTLIAAFALTSLSAFAGNTEPTTGTEGSENPAQTVEEQGPVVEPEQPVQQVPKEDLKFEGARWGGKAFGYVCEAAVTKLVETPSEYSALDVKWGTVVTDFTLDNGLLLATFTADEETNCRYSAIMLADSHTKSIKLIESRAWADVGEGSCVAGKTVLDNALAVNKYLWKESRKHLTILAPSLSAEATCGAGATAVGIDFVFTGRIPAAPAAH